VILASESGLDCSRALEKRERVRQRRWTGIQLVGTDVIDNNGLVSKDVFVFGGHSTRARVWAAGCLFVD
jgi:hypothetical protein